MTFKDKKIVRLLGRIINGEKTIIIQYANRSIATITFKNKNRRRAA